jgi:hypothetical protein
MAASQQANQPTSVSSNSPTHPSFSRNTNTHTHTKHTHTHPFTHTRAHKQTIERTNKHKHSIRNARNQTPNVLSTAQQESCERCIGSCWGIAALLSACFPSRFVDSAYSHSLHIVHTAVLVVALISIKRFGILVTIKQQPTTKIEC